jgi:hypothetical protein
MPPKTIYPRVNDDARRYSGDPALADIRKIQSEIRSRKPLATRSPYVDVDDDRDDDLARYRGEKEEPQVPQRPPMQALLEAMEEFDKKPLAQMDNRDPMYERAMNNPKNWVHCPMPNCGRAAAFQWALLDHLREKHPEIVRYDAWLRDKVQTPFLHWRKERRKWKDEYNRCADEIERRQPLLAAKQERKEKIQDKYGMSDAYAHGGLHSPEYQLAQEKAKDELQPVLKEIATVEGEIGQYKMRQHQAKWYFNIANGHIQDMEDDPHIRPLLKPINLAGGKQTWIFIEERKSLEGIVDAISCGTALERASWVVPGPSKGTIIPQGTGASFEKEKSVRHLQSYVREHDPDYM